MKKNAFTLAEVLITLSIIGVIAAVTLPSLQLNVNKKGLGSQVSKFYNTFVNAIESYKVTNSTDEITTDFDINDFARNYLKVAQKCNTTDACFAESYKTIKVADAFGSGVVFASKGPPPDGLRPPQPPSAPPVPCPTDRESLQTYQDTYKMADGSVFSIRTNGTRSNNEKCVLFVTFDVNGDKKPNIVGYDFHAFGIYSDGSVDAVGIDTDTRYSANATTTVENYFNNCTSLSGSGDTYCYTDVSGCFGHLYRNGFVFDY